MKTTVVAQVVRIAGVLDQQGKPTAPITVAATRQTLRKAFKSEKRGGALKIGEHELVLTPAPRRDPNTVEMFNAEGRPTEAALV